MKIQNSFSTELFLFINYLQLISSEFIDRFRNELKLVSFESFNLQVNQ